MTNFIRKFRFADRRKTSNNEFTREPTFLRIDEGTL